MNRNTILLWGLAASAAVFWTAALLSSQGLQTVLLVVLGPTSSSTSAPTPYRVRAVDASSKQGVALLGGEVRDARNAVVAPVGKDGVLWVPPTTSEVLVVDVDTAIGTTQSVFATPPLQADTVDLALRAVPVVDEVVRRPNASSTTHNATAYPVFHSTRSMLATSVLLVDGDQLQVTTAEPHVLWTELDDKRRLRASRVRQVVQRDDPDVTGSKVSAVVQSASPTSAWLDVYVDGRLRHMQALDLVAGDLRVEVPATVWSEVAQDGHLVLRVSETFSQNDVGAVLHLRVRPSSMPVTTWAVQQFDAHGGAADDPLRLWLTSTTAKDHPQRLLAVQALLGRLTATHAKPQVKNPTLQHQQADQRDRRRRRVQRWQWPFRLSALAFWALLLGSNLARRRRDDRWQQALEEDGLLDDDDSSSAGLSLEDKGVAHRLVRLLLIAATLFVVWGLDWALQVVAG